MQGDALTEADLAAIPAFGKLLVSRAGRPLSHANTLDECKRLAGLWLNSPDGQLPDSDLTGVHSAHHTPTGTVFVYFDRQHMHVPVLHIHMLHLRLVWSMHHRRISVSIMLL